MDKFPSYLCVYNLVSLKGETVLFPDERKHTFRGARNAVLSPPVLFARWQNLRCLILIFFYSLSPTQKELTRHLLLQKNCFLILWKHLLSSTHLSPSCFSEQIVRFVAFQLWRKNSVNLSKLYILSFANASDWGKCRRCLLSTQNKPSPILRV